MVLIHRSTLSAFLLLLSSGPLLIPNVHAFQTENRVPAAPFNDPARFSAMEQQLPSLEINTSQENAFSTRLAQIAKSIGEASENDSNASFGQQAGVWAFNHLRDEVADRLINEGQSLLSPYGTAQLSLQVDMDGNFVGSGGQLLTPWQDNYQYLTFSQLGVTQTDDGLVGNAGLGQRWVAGNWLLGYNALVDRQFDSGLQRASLGTEAWSDFLRLSANYYAPLGGWRNNNLTEQNRMARGYDITTQGYLPFYRQLGVSVTWEQYLGDDVDLFHNGNQEKNPVAVKVGVNYTPVPLLTFTASHKEGENGQSQDQLGMRVTWRPGVALSKQLSADNVAQARSLRGSRYDLVERNTAPVLEFRQRKSLSVFLATPPWQLSPGETLTLKLQIRAANEITHVSWQGDTQALSLTPPSDNRSPQGWTVIMPAWDNTPGASNEYRLSVTLEDSKQQRVTSNWITLQLTPPMSLPSSDTDRFDVMQPAP